MGHTQLPHYHIRWSGKTTLDWEHFSERAEAEASARQLMRPGEAYTIEEYDGTRQRCQETMKLKAPHSSNEASA